MVKKETEVTRVRKGSVVHMDIREIKVIMDLEGLLGPKDPWGRKVRETLSTVHLI